MVNHPNRGKKTVGHTPAPWRELKTRIDDARGYQICHLDLHGKSEAERDANRRLIAAAPDLLEVLQQIMATSADFGETVRARATNAIAKATQS